MKKIGAKSTSGPEAIIIAILQYWLGEIDKERIGTNREVLCLAITKIIKQVPPAIFKNKLDYSLGEAICNSGLAIDKFTDDFMGHAKANSITKYMMELAVSNHKAGTIAQKVAWAYKFIERCMVTELGAIARETVAHNIHAE